MSEPANLSDVPGKLLNRRNWNSLRSFASKEIIALSYINAPYPDEADQSSFFWDRRGSDTDAIRCYRAGRSLLTECRSLLNERKLIATGVDKRTGNRKTIPASEWINLWPMFATNRAVGPDREFAEVTVSEVTFSDTPHEMLTCDCTTWLKEQKVAGINAKKTTLHQDARQLFGSTLTHAIFDAAYLAAFGRGRGRPKKNAAKS